MMIWRRKNKSTANNPIRDKVAAKIARGFFLVQAKFSNTMNKRIATLPRGQLKVLLIGFWVFSGGLSCYFILNAVFFKPQPAIKIDQVKVPKHFNKAGDEVMDNIMPPEIYLEMQEYKRYMDSIGQPIRPGLRDSMQMLEEIYLQQQK